MRQIAAVRGGLFLKSPQIAAANSDFLHGTDDAKRVVADFGVAHSRRTFDLEDQLLWEFVSQ